MKITRILSAGLVMTRLLIGGIAFAGALNPECTPEKAAKGAAAKATVGVGGRCKPAETVKDTTKRATGVDDKNRNDDEGPVKRIVDKAKSE